VTSSLRYVVPDVPTTADKTILGRICRVHRDACDVLTTNGEIRADLAPSILTSTGREEHLAPAVGDLCVLSIEASPRILELLPRKSAVTRASVTPGSSQRQVLAANLDVLAIVEPLSKAPTLGRVERLLTLAWESGATPLVVLSKADLTPDPESWVAMVSEIAPGAEVIAVSLHDGSGLADLRRHLRPGLVLAFVGPSGAGKSSLVNVLAGADLMAIADIRQDGRGRHTTVHRELVVLQDGSLVVDTPGLRSVGLASPEALDRTFSDVTALAQLCRFNDCAHDTEPDCAVQAAIAEGSLDPRRLRSWQKLQREAAYQSRRTDARLQAAERGRWKAFAKQNRQRGHR
jgi:ribosome biogenesis GTPase / thiamine phosphate phosphatase